MITGTDAPVGRVVAAGGGHHVTGRWGWGGAAPLCDWVVGGAMPPDGPRLMIFPLVDVTVHDTWHATDPLSTASVRSRSRRTCSATWAWPRRGCRRHGHRDLWPAQVLRRTLGDIRNAARSECGGDRHR